MNIQTLFCSLRNANDLLECITSRQVEVVVERVLFVLQQLLNFSRLGRLSRVDVTVSQREAPDMHC